MKTILIVGIIYLSGVIADAVTKSSYATYDLNEENIMDTLR